VSQRNVDSLQPRTSAITTVAVSGLAVSDTQDAWFEYDLKVDAISVATMSTDFCRMMELVSHGNAGGQFALLVNDDATATTLVTCCTQGDTVLEITSSTGLTAADTIYMEDASDPSKWQLAIVDSVDDGTHITLDSSTPTGFAYTTLSTIRIWEYFPACIFRKPAAIKERGAGKGASIWDLRLQLRTVRS
jgi:hypothetical protein